MSKEQLKEENIFYNRLSNCYFTAIIVLSGGLAGLLLSYNMTIKIFLLFIFGVYADCICIIRHQNYNKLIEKNIKELT